MLCFTTTKSAEGKNMSSEVTRQVSAVVLGGTSTFYGILIYFQYIGGDNTFKYKSI